MEEEIVENASATTVEERIKRIIHLLQVGNYAGVIIPFGMDPQAFELSLRKSKR